VGNRRAEVTTDDSRLIGGASDPTNSTRTPLKLRRQAKLDERVLHWGWGNVIPYDEADGVWQLTKWMATSSGMRPEHQVECGMCALGAAGKLTPDYW